MAHDGKNSLGSKAAPFLEQIESINAQIATLTGEHMARCKNKRAERKAVFSSAKDAGITTRALSALVTNRSLQKKIEELASDFDQAEAAAYRELCETLGPLGAAAAAAAGFAAGEEDVRPEFMRRAERERADAADTLAG